MVNEELLVLGSRTTEASEKKKIKCKVYWEGYTEDTVVYDQAGTTRHSYCIEFYSSSSSRLWTAGSLHVWPHRSRLLMVSLVSAGCTGVWKNNIITMTVGVNMKLKNTYNPNFICYSWLPLSHQMYFHPLVIQYFAFLVTETIIVKCQVSSPETTDASESTKTNRTWTENEWVKLHWL